MNYVGIDLHKRYSVCATQFVQTSLPRLGDSRHGENPMTHAPATAASRIGIIVIMVRHYK